MQNVKVEKFPVPKKINLETAVNFFQEAEDGSGISMKDLEQTFDLTGNGLHKHFVKTGSEEIAEKLSKRTSLTPQDAYRAVCGLKRIMNGNGKKIVTGGVNL